MDKTKLQIYLKELSQAERTWFAEQVGTTFHHLRNCGYGSRVLGTQECVRIEEITKGAIKRQDLRPDWSLHWPELRPSYMRRVVKRLADSIR